MASKHSVYVFLGSFCIYSEKATCVYVLGTLMHCLTQNTDLSWNSIYGITASVLIDNFFFFLSLYKECCSRPNTDKMSSRGGKKKSTKTSRSAKAGVIFPVGRMLRYIKKGHPKYRIGVGAPVYMAAVLEYLTGRFCWTMWNSSSESNNTNWICTEKKPQKILWFIGN